MSDDNERPENPAEAAMRHVDEAMIGSEAYVKQQRKLGTRPTWDLVRRAWQNGYTTSIEVGRDRAKKGWPR